MREIRNAYRILFGRAEGKIPFGWPRNKRKNNAKMDLSDSMEGKMDSSESQLGLVVGL
jgi:hypothetical protein